MKTTLFILIIVFTFNGCYMATKMKELGQSVSNINHPLGLILGITLYNTGKVLEQKKDIESIKKEIKWKKN